MGPNRQFSHLVVTPNRDEEKFLPKLISSMCDQTITPTSWIIVDDNSTDSSAEIIQEAMKKYDWIEYIRIDNDSKRRRGSHIADLVNRGISQSNIDWDFFSKIDADMILPSDYFEKIFLQFSENPLLGIASGSCHIIKQGKKYSEHVTTDHTRGGLKTYKRSCFNEIEGIKEVDGWDGIDNIMAQMNGWETRNFPSISVEHRRITGSYFGIVRGCFESGKFAYSMRYFLPFMIARSAHRSFSRPLFIGGISMLAGYFFGLFSRSPPAADRQVTGFLRKKQIHRMLFFNRN